MQGSVPRAKVASCPGTGKESPVDSGIPIILDCDPGTDDALALLLTLASPELDVLAVTAAGGNVGLDLTLANALAITALAGSAVPVYSGADRPLLGAFVNEPRVHGVDGLGGVALPRGGPPAPGIAADAIRRILREATRPVTLVGIAPVTNLALALMTEPALAAQVEQIVLMSGAWGEGNATPAAEFNALNDPEALAVLLDCGRPVVFATLELTALAQATPERIAALRARGEGRCLRAACDIQASVPTVASPRSRWWRAAARSLRHRLAAAARPVHLASVQRAHGSRPRPEPRPNRDRSLEPHGRAAQRLGAGNAGRRRVLRFARRAAGAVAVTDRGRNIRINCEPVACSGVALPRQVPSESAGRYAEDDPPFFRQARRNGWTISCLHD